MTRFLCHYILRYIYDDGHKTQHRLRRAAELQSTLLPCITEASQRSLHPSGQGPKFIKNRLALLFRLSLSSEIETDGNVRMEHYPPSYGA